MGRLGVTTKDVGFLLGVKMFWQRVGMDARPCDYMENHRKVGFKMVNWIIREYQSIKGKAVAGVVWPEGCQALACHGGKGQPLCAQDLVGTVWEGAKLMHQARSRARGGRTRGPVTHSQRRHRVHTGTRTGEGALPLWPLKNLGGESNRR